MLTTSHRVHAVLVGAALAACGVSAQVRGGALADNDSDVLLRVNGEAFTRADFVYRELWNFQQGVNNLAALLQATNRVAEAEPLLRRALAISEASVGEAHPDVAISLNNLARLLEATNRVAEAEPLLRRALAISEAGVGEAHPAVGIMLIKLASLLLGARPSNRFAISGY